MRLDELLKDYKDTSLSMVEKVKGNEDISSFLKKRDSIINEIIAWVLISKLYVME